MGPDPRTGARERAPISATGAAFGAGCAQGEQALLGRAGVSGARGVAPRPSLVYCADDAGAKGIAAGLIFDIGFDSVDDGPPRIARRGEPFALLVGQLACEQDGGPKLDNRFERFRG